MRQLGKLSNGNIIVEMEPMEWLTLICGTERFYDIPTICREYRAENHLSKTDPARKLGISRNWVHRMEQGETNISLALYRRLIALAFRDKEVCLEG